MTKKINITLRDDLLERMDSYSQNNAMTRSGLIALAVTQYLNAVEAMPSVNKLLASMAAVAEGTLNGQLVPDEANKKLDEIQKTYAAIYGSK